MTRIQRILDDDPTKLKTLRFKVIRPVFEKLTIKEDLPDYLTSKTPVSSSKMVHELFSFLGNEAKEHFLALHLDSKNKILCIDQISTGSLNASIVHPREVFKSCLLSSAAAIVLVHNHPSGEPQPSVEDKQLTTRLKEGCDLLGMRLLDHVIIGDEGRYFSFADNGLLAQGGG